MDRRKRILHLARRLIIAALATILIWTVITMLFEDKFIFFPTAYPGGMYEDTRFIRGLKDSMIVAEDGVRIHTWFAPADSAVATLVISHGNAGNISHRIEIIRRLQNTGFHVLMFDYRGYGKSEGSPSEEGIYRDGRAAFDYAAMIPGVDPKKIFLWGTSLGGAVAVDVATRRPAAGLILESSFSSARDVARVAYPFLPIYLVLSTQLDSYEKIQRIRTPLFMMHGDEDSIIPIELGKKLFGAANEPKEFFVIAGADHNNVFLVGGREYLEKSRDFIVKTTERKTK